MYGMMPSAKIVTCDRLPPENMSYEAEHVFCICLAELRERAGVDARASGCGCRRGRRQQPEREEHAVAQVGDGEDVA